MKLTLIRNVILLALLASFSQFTFADNASAQKTIAGVLHNLNHFPSDADKAALMAISEDESVGQGYRALAGAVANISHGATAEGKAVTARIMEASQAPADLKTLAGIVASLNHTASADAKATLAAMM
tara:strand:- start:476 stop:856 length:381 start_codon:yes stop_codon:yes gene_type:complete